MYVCSYSQSLQVASITFTKVECSVHSVVDIEKPEGRYSSSGSEIVPCSSSGLGEHLGYINVESVLILLFFNEICQSLKDI